jgi:hypothetical protein
VAKVVVLVVVEGYKLILSITNKMQSYTIFFIAVNALYVSGGFFAPPQELKTVQPASGI